MSATQNQYSLKSFNTMIQTSKTQEYLAKVLGEKRASFVSNVSALVANDNKLQQCEPVSIMYAAIKATALDLPLDQNLGLAYVIPFWNGKKGVMEAQFQLGTRAFIQLAMRTKQLKNLNVRDVREGEILGEDFVSGEMTFRRREHREELPIVGYVSFFETQYGFRKMLYMSVDELRQHALKYSQTYANERTRQFSPWTTNFEAMCSKTALKLLLSKYAPISVETEAGQALQQGIVSDQAVLNETGVDTYIDNNEESVATIENVEEVTDNLCNEVLDDIDKVDKKKKDTSNQ